MQKENDKGADSDSEKTYKGGRGRQTDKQKEWTIDLIRDSVWERITGQR